MRLSTKIPSILLAAGAVTLVGCAAEDSSTEDQELAASSYAGDAGTGKGDYGQYDRFKAFDQSGNDAYGVQGFLPPNSELSHVYHGMDESQRRGLATWHLFAAERGDFFRVSQKVTWNGSNMLRVIDSRIHEKRFEEIGVLNDPDCTAPTGPDQFGLYIDNCPRDPYSTGIVGLRLRPNPDFDLAAWKKLGNGDVNKAAEIWLRKPKNRFDWKSDAMEEIVAVEPPYEVSMTCTVCHAAPNPINPPANPNHAKWNNIVFALGNQFFQESKVFGDGMPSDDFLSQVIGSQHPGTSDTSRMATDHIFNPNTINSIENLPYRALHKERVKQWDDKGRPVYNEDIDPARCDGTTCEVDTFRVLKDGGDSSGVTGAVLRVFINVGSCFPEFSKNMDPVWGARHPTSPGRTETPISRYNLTEYCKDYQRLIPLAPHLFNYLNFLKPFRITEHPEGAKYVKPWNDPQLELGRKVFAEECATCHSSLQPEYPDGKPTRADALFERSFATWTKEQQIAWLKDPSRVAWFRSKVENPEFFEKNYMSDERRYPISLIGTNSARALGTNAGEGNVWEQYASVDYRTLPATDVPLYKFKWGKIELVKSVKGPVGRGYYRTPSLWGIWTSAPFLNNNGLGIYSGKWDLESRLVAYQDGMERLLGLRARTGHFAKTNRFTALTTIPIGFELPFPIPGIDLDKLKLGLPVPPGVPVASVANLELGVLHTTQFTLADVIRILTDGPEFFSERLKDFITVFDPIEDKGHEFGYGRTEAEKRALIEFLKTL